MLLSYLKDVKVSSVSDGKQFKVFNVVADLEDQSLKKFLAWLRLVNYEGAEEDVKNYT